MNSQLEELMREAPVAAAARELLEEAGYVAGSLHYAGQCKPVPGLLTLQLHIVLAHDCVFEQEPDLEALELMTVDLWTEAELRE